MPVFRLNRQIAFPDPRLAEPNGLIAIEGDLRPKRLLAAYAAGIFPWYSEGQPILWFSPDPRMIFEPDKFTVSKSLARVLRSGKFEVRADTRFEDVIQACALAPRHGQEGTWITAAMIEAYRELHRRGYAHSFETYEDGQLVGGLYGLSLGKAFFGESMYHESRDASKVAFAALNRFCARQGFAFIDAQLPNPHLTSLGGIAIPRSDFLRRLQTALEPETLAGPWTSILSEGA